MRSYYATGLMPKKKILILANTFYPILGGVETHLADLVKSISQEGDLEAHLIAYTYWGDKNNPYVGRHGNLTVQLLKLCSANPKSLSNWLQIHSYPFYFSFTILPMFFYVFFYCLKHKNFDIAHANSHTTGITAVLISRIFGIKKKFISMHGFMFSQQTDFQRYNKARWIIKSQFKRFDKIFCVGQRSYNENRELMDGDPANKIEMFRYWVGDIFFKAEQDKKLAKAKLGLADRKIVFYAGRLVATKGILVLLEVAKQMPQYDFAIAGDGISTEVVKEQSQQHKNIKFLGALENKIMPEWLAATDVSILLTQNDGEGIPRALVESITCGTPVLALAKGGTKELVDFGTGLVLENNIEDIKSKIELMLTDSEIYNQKRKNCRPIAEKYFSKDNAQIFIRNYRF